MGSEIGATARGVCRPDVHCVLSSLLGPVDPSFRALSGRPKFTFRRHKFNEESLSCGTNWQGRANGAGARNWEHGVVEFVGEGGERGRPDVGSGMGLAELMWDTLAGTCERCVEFGAGSTA